ncbi:MAG: ribonuclease HII [Caldilinea sp.]|nr:ribonuclease HII [Caldilinea sp.]MDW8440718.1 ribonuclease HII [Caldilineaceae bacterium]
MSGGISCKRNTPDLQVEQSLWVRGFLRVAGVDEAGRGALAGPVVAAAVLVTPESGASPIWASVCDSKLLAPAQRIRLADEIRRAAAAWAIGEVDAATIDAIGIAAATRRAMHEAIAALSPAADYLLLDWVRLPSIGLPQQAQARADRTMASVAAASILAKVHRDRLMQEYDRRYPEYQFAVHKGYGVAAHCAAIERFGPCPIHRCTFAPIARRATLFDADDNA